MTHSHCMMSRGSYFSGRGQCCVFFNRSWPFTLFYFLFACLTNDIKIVLYTGSSVSLVEILYAWYFYVWVCLTASAMALPVVLTDTPRTFKTDALHQMDNSQQGRDCQSPRQAMPGLALPSVLSHTLALFDRSL